MTSGVPWKAGEGEQRCRPETTEALEHCGLYAPPLGSPSRALGHIPATNVSKAPLEGYWGPEVEPGLPDTPTW